MFFLIFSLWCSDHFSSSYNAARSHCDVNEMVVRVEDGRDCSPFKTMLLTHLFMILLNWRNHKI